jgi:pimeloyl-ACP methyl ester carboxylesterase
MRQIHYVVYSHGFGVRKDDRGLMTDIAAALPECEHVLFDYNTFDEAANTMTVSPLNIQVAKLKERLESLGNNPNVIIDLIAHSQGCVVAALARPNNVRKMMFLAPPDNMDKEKLIKFFGNRPGSHINLQGESRIPRRDGTTTVVPQSYWKSIESLQPIRLYNYLPTYSKVKFYIANDDEVLGASNFDNTNPGIDLIQIAGNHDFNNGYRKALVSLISEQIGE